MVTGEDEVRVTVANQPAFRVRKDLSREYDVIKAKNGCEVVLLKVRNKNAGILFDFVDKYNLL